MYLLTKLTILPVTYTPKMKPKLQLSSLKVIIGVRVMLEQKLTLRNT